MGRGESVKKIMEKEGGSSLDECRKKRLEELWHWCLIYYRRGV